MSYPFKLLADCNKIITDVYSHPDLLRLINKIKPEGIRDDLRQEIAISLLEQPCDKVAALFAGDNLLRYAIRMCWLMATSNQTSFYKKFRQSDLLKAVEYMRSMQPLQTIPLYMADRANEVLKAKSVDKYTDHEARLFNKYVELGKCDRVARYYGLPRHHVRAVINKVKKELKEHIKTIS